METQAKHTPGPWHVGTGNGEGSIFADAGRMRLESGGTTLYPICKINGSWAGREDETAANARLIAAAPDLLDRLAYIADMAEFSIDDANLDLADKLNEIVRIARAAIARATGEAVQS